MKSIVKYSIIFWIIFFLVVSFFLSPAGSTERVTLHVSTFIFPQMILFYLNWLILLPRFFERRKVFTYIGILVILVGLHTSIFGSLDIFMDEKYPLDILHFRDRPIKFIYLGRFMSSIPPLLIAALVHKSVLLQKKNKESLELQNKMLAAETKALKAQINPHFLFNTLNNIYSLSQLKSEHTGNAILQLSDILRYVTYEGNERYVSLEKELAVIESFIALQHLKDKDSSNIDIQIETEETHLKIAPLLLIPFVENSFKHGNHHDKENGWIHIEIKTQQNRLYLKITNTFLSKEGPKDKVGGVGLENVKRRLELLYPDEYTLDINKKSGTYAVTLELTLSP